MAAVAMSENDIRTKIVAIMMDKSLTEEEKGRKRQELLMGRWATTNVTEESKHSCSEVAPKDLQKENTQITTLDENLQCNVCLNLCDRPVTAPCQHNYCLGCFKKWCHQGKKTCPTCRAPFPSKFSQNPRINTALAFAIRLAKNPVKADKGPSKDFKRIDNENRPDEAFVTERAVKTGRANASSGRIMVTTPNDHFGPIGPEYDPTRNQGVLVGEWWKDRLDCRQWGAHYPHVAGIAGQSNVGAQSVVLSGGYEDDQDEGEWFLYTGSGGRDLSGNKRTNKVQSFDQEFENMNKALKFSCTRGLPVRVVRSFKEKRSSYAPTVDTPVRYDGVYRILRCWRKPGNQKHLICRYLFVRCDNAPAPWSSAEGGDVEHLDVPKEAQAEIKQAAGAVYEMTKEPAWTWLPEQQSWGWASGKRPDTQQRSSGGSKPLNAEKKLKKKLSEHEKALKEFKCEACRGTLNNPLRTPCGHNFCKGCLEKRFDGITDVQAPNAARELRVRRNTKPCPTCKSDLCEFLATAQVNREMVAVIQKLKAEISQACEQAAKLKEDGAEPEGDGHEQEDEEEGAEPTSEKEDVTEEEEEEDDIGDSKANGKACRGNVGPVRGDKTEEASEAEDVPTEAAAGPSGCSPAPAPSQRIQSDPADKYAAELAMLTSEFPDFDRELIRSLLEDQAGDMLDVRAMLRMTKRPAKKPSSPAAVLRGKQVANNKKKKSQDEDEQEAVGADGAEEPSIQKKTKRASGKRQKL
ncbi:hypothetical protein CEUSTIGMA_g12000.t1 [Chlamydomonas eustigma]|uniref:RING-type E3 ubiquitin transferase n=1 Tax=Chlamydomonas eustigma TaxID=1157962 RepID=A0A250XNQ5_9CHLO|nr:hypothetical protein CEUSTIGMA_g12000.t1 [Chlamydomonas eustigma]|eukprot:GAX84579.1 hypothetical protein CEUSTIGMA_g12000.t1 [Chlamydomonas eustigma]